MHDNLVATRLDSLSVRLRVICVAFALLFAAYASVAMIGRPAATVVVSSDGYSDVTLYSDIAVAVGAGENYYAAAARDQRAHGYPVRPVFTVRPPLLAMIAGHVGPRGMQMLMVVLVFATAMAWLVRLEVPLRLPMAAVTALVIMAGAAPSVVDSATVFHESWAAILIALAIALWRPERPVWSITVALIAALIRELAMPFLAMMLAYALLNRRWGEAAKWTAALIIWALCFGLHAHAVLAVGLPGDLPSQGWMGLGGWPRFVSMMGLVSALWTVPLTLASPLLALSLIGWLSWKHETGLIATGWLCGATLMIMLFARADLQYWAMLVVPLQLAGLVFLPFAIAAAIGRPIMVTRRSSPQPALR